MKGNCQMIYGIVDAGGTSMIEKLANTIVVQMIERDYCTSDMKEHYVYALIITVEKWITLATIFGISLMARKVISTILFEFFFFSLRKRTGGYHTEKFWQCYMGTVFTYVVIVLFQTFWVKHIELLLGATFVCAIVIGYIGTVNHPNMAMSKTEVHVSQKVARQVLFVELTVIICGMYCRFPIVYICYMLIAIILCAVLMVIAKILKQEVK